MVSAAQRAQAAWQQAAQAAIANTAAQKELKTAMEAAAAVGDLDARAMTALAQAKRNAAQAAQQLAAAEKGAAVAMEAEAAAARGAAGAEEVHAVSMHEAKGAAALLGEEVGLKLNRHLRGVLASSEMLGPVLEAAFPIAAAIGFFEVISKGAEKLSEMISDWLIYTEEMKKAYAAELALNKQLVDGQAERQRIERDIFERTHSDSAVRQADLDAERNHLAQLTRDLAAAQQKFRETTHKGAAEAAVPGATSVDEMGDAHTTAGEVSKKTGEEIAAAGREVGKLNDDLKTSKDRVQQLGLELKGAVTEETKKAADAAREHTQALAETERALEQQAALQMKLKEAGLGNIVANMPGGDVTSHYKGDLGQMAEAVRHAHEEMNREVEASSKSNSKTIGEQFDEYIKGNEKAIEAAKELREVQDLQAQAARDKALAPLQEQEQGVKNQAALGQITPQQELARLQALHELMLAEEQRYIQRKKAIDAGDEKALAHDALEAQHLEHKAKMQELADQQAMLLQKQKSFQTYFSNITGMLNQNVMQWVSGHERFGQAMEKVWNHMAMNFIQNMMLMAEQEIAAEVLHQTLAHKSILVDAKSAAAKAFNWASGWGGPVAGAVAAALAFAGVVSFDSFETGGIVPNTGLAMVHQGEGVLTKPATQMLQTVMSTVNNGGLSQGNGGMTYNDQRQIHAWDGASAKRAMRNSTKQLVKEVQRAGRMGKFGGLR
jgi:hypothetical protein